MIFLALPHQALNHPALSLLLLVVPITIPAITVPATTATSIGRTPHHLYCLLDLHHVRLHPPQETEETQDPQDDRQEEDEYNDGIGLHTRTPGANLHVEELAWAGRVALGEAGWIVG
jgi:hypothetical protein